MRIRCRLQPKILQFSTAIFFRRGYVLAEVRERTDHFLHALVVFKKHVSLRFIELGTALRMGVAIGSARGSVEVPGSMARRFNDLFSSGNSPRNTIDSYIPAIGACDTIVNIKTLHPNGRQLSLDWSELFNLALQSRFLLEHKRCNPTEAPGFPWLGAKSDAPALLK